MCKCAEKQKVINKVVLHTLEQLMRQACGRPQLHGVDVYLDELKKLLS